MQNLKIFDNEEFGQVRVVMKDGEPWFVGNDVARALRYSSPRSVISKNTDIEDRGVAEMETPSGTQTMTIINESGLYSLIMSSRLPSAKKFKHWVTAEVLPSLRKNGTYLITDAQGQITELVQQQISSMLAQTIPMIVGEVMKQMAPVLTSCIGRPASTQDVKEQKTGGRNRTRIRTRVDMLPTELKSHVISMLMDPRIRYDDIVIYCMENGEQVSRSSLCRYGKKLEQRMGGYEITLE